MASLAQVKQSRLWLTQEMLCFQSRLQIYDLTMSVLCSPSEVPEGGFPNRIPMVLRGNCTFYEKVRLAQINGAKGLLVVSKDRLVIRPHLFSNFAAVLQTRTHLKLLHICSVSY